MRTPRETSPITNYFYKFDDKSKRLELQSYWSMFHTATSIYAEENHNKKLVDAHKAAFGKQTYTTILSGRFWVWEFDGYVVCMNNSRGISLEINEGVSTDKAISYMKEYVEGWPFDMEEVMRIRSTEKDISKMLQQIHDLLSPNSTKDIK